MQPFYSYSRKDYVVIVASDTDGRFLCVRQFRQGIRQVTNEFPAGGIERTDGRESDQSLDDTEFVEVVRVSAEEIEDMIAKGEFQQAMHITAWLLEKR